MPKQAFPKWLVDILTNHEKRMRKLEAALGVTELSVIRLADETKKREDKDRSSSYPDVDEKGDGDEIQEMVKEDAQTKGR